MISHDRAQELISARMDAPLSPAEHHELQGHIATCTACRVFVAQSDDIARDLQVMPRLMPSPMVSRAVMTAISTDSANAGWGWLRHGLQALSSPGMAVASSMALILALASALIVALNAPDGASPGTGVTPEGTISAVAVAPLPTDVPTEAPRPTEPAVEPTEERAEPTATRGPVRTVAPAPTEAPKTPTPRPTATSVPIIDTSGPIEQPVIESPPIQPANATGTDELVDEPVLGMASDESQGAEGSADLAQAAETAAEPVDVQEVVEEPVASKGEAVEPAPSEGDGEPAPETASAPEETDSGQKDSGRKGDGDKVASDEAPVEPEPTRPIGPLPVEAIAALEGAGSVPDLSLPPAPLNPTQPDQSFLPVTPTPETDGTPTPESEQAAESEAPQLAEEWSGDLGVTALAPEEPAEEAPVIAEGPSETTTDSKKIKNKEKNDKESKAGKSHEEQQAAFVESPMGWSSQPVDPQEVSPQPVELLQTTEYPVAPEQATEYPVEPQPSSELQAEPVQTGEYPVDASSTSGEGVAPADTAETAPEPQIDPATGMQIDPATGYLIDPTTGYLLDRVNGRVIDPRTSYEVHPGTGLLIDPLTGAMLDPNTLAIVIPAGFGTDQPAYNPGDPNMRGSIETVVDDTYNSASIRMEPATDGPVQPIGEIVVPTESGDAVEIS